ncbi:hypothetical protein PP939_gp207 [Rhizobium phage RL38J1]|uniref:Uncharacterized protein n=1 Tax=Rhizobium phage RL38J1 TaxID=2663232 RepID=A0A6B9J3I2_9CAUD|nr:hypothetical protein PP939_gp207 [Rhizobium phage RL38J1]QGZ14028.1 hypothetical protein RL38J1_207 [Rhizobium phage RL38J1]
MTDKTLTMDEAKKLILLIKKATRAHNDVHLADRELNNFCEEIWGFAPSDRDVDEIIDSVFGGCSLSRGMSIFEFTAAMNKAI